MATISKWQKWSTYAAIGSTLASILAIVLGIWQFNIAIHKADLQLKGLDDDRRERLAENRPLMVVKKTEVNVYENSHPGIPPGWDYTITFENIGIRPANNLCITDMIIAADYDFIRSDSSSYYKICYQNPVNKSEVLNHVNTVDFKKMRNYYLRVNVSYYDVVLKRTFNQSYFYTINLDLTDQGYFPTYPLFDDDKPEHYKKADSIMRKYYPHNY